MIRKIGYRLVYVITGLMAGIPAAQADVMMVGPVVKEFCKQAQDADLKADFIRKSARFLAEQHEISALPESGRYFYLSPLKKPHSDHCQAWLDYYQQVLHRLIADQETSPSAKYPVDGVAYYAHVFTALYPDRSVAQYRAADLIREQWVDHPDLWQRWQQAR